MSPSQLPASPSPPPQTSTSSKPFRCYDVKRIVLIFFSLNYPFVVSWGRWVGVPQIVPTAWPCLGSETHWLALVSHFSMHKWAERKSPLPCRTPISGNEGFFPVWTSSCQPRAMTIASLLMGGYGLEPRMYREKPEEYLCEVWVLKTWHNLGYSNFNECTQ